MRKEHLNILVIEDNPGDCLIIEDCLLEQFGNVNIHFKNSFEDVSIFVKENKHALDITLLDLTLPDKSGEYLIKEVLHLINEIPVIILTGYTDMDFSEKSISYGVADYLLKEELTPHVIYKSISYSLQRKKNLDNLKNSERKYSDLFHLNPSPMWIYDLDSLDFLKVNEAAINFYGYTESEFLKMNLRDIKLEDDFRTLEEDKSLIKTDHQVFSHRIYRHQLKNKEIRFVDVTGSKINFENLNAELVLVHDFTNEISYINAIENKNKRLKEIAYTQSHIVRAPLARLMGLSNLLKDENMNSNEFQELMSYLDITAKELDDVIKDIVNKTSETE